jgi:hypothetical protein
MCGSAVATDMDNSWSEGQERKSASLRMCVRPTDGPGIDLAVHLHGKHVGKIFATTVKSLLLFLIGAEYIIV